MLTSTPTTSTGVEVIAAITALADPVRLSVLEVLAHERCVCDLLERVRVPGNLFSYDLPVLREAGLIVSTRRGRSVDCRLYSGGFTQLWHALATAGVPLPGETTAGTRAGRPCVARGSK